MHIQLIEPLESRIAPALLIGPGGKSATYTDVDGDLVTVKVSKGALDAGDFTLMNSGAGQILKKLNFADDGVEFSGSDLSIVATPQNGSGDGFVNVGWMEATGVTLGNLLVDGDLA